MRFGLHDYSVEVPKAHTYAAKQYCFTRQTILFHVSNTCVWCLKQYYFIGETHLFDVRNAYFIKLKDLFHFIHLQFVREGTQSGTIVLRGKNGRLKTG